MGSLLFAAVAVGTFIVADAAAADNGVNTLVCGEATNKQGVTDRWELTKFGDSTVHVVLVDIDARMEKTRKAEKIADAVNDDRFNGVKQFDATANGAEVVITDTNGDAIEKIKLVNHSSQKWDSAIVAGAQPPTDDRIRGMTRVEGTASGANSDGAPAVFRVGAKVGATEGFVELQTVNDSFVGALLDAAVSSLRSQGIDAPRDGGEHRRDACECWRRLRSGNRRHGAPGDPQCREHRPRLTDRTASRGRDEKSDRGSSRLRGPPFSPLDESPSGWSAWRGAWESDSPWGSSSDNKTPVGRQFGPSRGRRPLSTRRPRNR